MIKNNDSSNEERLVAFLFVWYGVQPDWLGSPQAWFPPHLPKLVRDNIANYMLRIQMGHGRWWKRVIEKVLGWTEDERRRASLMIEPIMFAGMPNVVPDPPLDLPVRMDTMWGMDSDGSDEDRTVPEPPNIVGPSADRKFGFKDE